MSQIHLQTSSLVLLMVTWDDSHGSSVSDTAGACFMIILLPEPSAMQLPYRHHVLPSLLQSAKGKCVFPCCR